MYNLRRTMSKSWASSISKTGEFVRRPSAFRNWISADGDFKAEAGRYHLCVSLACPWAHRTLIMRNLKGLQTVFPYTVVDWFMGSKGWTFTHQKPKCTLDTVNNANSLRELYHLADKDYNLPVTVPALWDKKNKTIVNNESSEIIRMMNTDFNEFCSTVEQRELDFYPAHLRAAIDDMNSWIYPEINNGVYRSGFATTQEAYDEAFTTLFNALDRHYTGDDFTEADIRLFTTLIRFDSVYVGHFKCNLRRLVDYPNLWAYTREIYQMPGVAETVDFEHIKKHYYMSHKSINPHGIVPNGPASLDLLLPHNREHLSA